MNRSWRVVRPDYETPLEYSAPNNTQPRERSNSVWDDAEKRRIQEIAAQQYAAIMERPIIMKRRPTPTYHYEEDDSEEGDEEEEIIQSTVMYRHPQSPARKPNMHEYQVVDLAELGLTDPWPGRRSGSPNKQIIRYPDYRKYGQHGGDEDPRSFGRGLASAPAYRSHQNDNDRPRSNYPFFDSHPPDTAKAPTSTPHSAPSPNRTTPKRGKSHKNDNVQVLSVQPVPEKSSVTKADDEDEDEKRRRRRKRGRKKLASMLFYNDEEPTPPQDSTWLD